MTQKNLEAYIISKWGPPTKTVSQISSRGDSGSLVSSEEKMYCFDDICKKIYVPHSLPTSADGLVFHPKYIELIEFKSGFKEIISKDNFDKEKAKCSCKGDICKDFWREFRRARKLEKDDLIDSLRIKAIESYITLDQRLFPFCEDLPEKQLRIKLTIVIDAEETDTIEDTLAILAGKKPGKENQLKRIRDTVSRLQCQEDIYGHRYFYDDIEVVSALEFQKRLGRKSVE